MIILDTNVLSALMRDRPDPAVISWLDEQPAESIWTTAVTVLEVRMGLELLRVSRRRTQLETAFNQLCQQDLDGRVLAFDTTAADAAAIALAAAQRRGQSIEIRDGQIAGICLARRATLATGNIRHFEPLRVTVVDPWGGS
ncbi:MAG TPA: type II toxin-antitoxin system VapC family toxin [Mycobacteriales bacterium]|nr:type II toxin-antitoxin system VapC family toxin [Mycobacteriales bacterium]